MQTDQIAQNLRHLRKRKQLHSVVESRLVEIVYKVAPELHPIKEPLGLAGGRNDLMLFDFSGKKVLFEIFATASQVSRDLRIMDMTKADVKIAVIIDEDIDPKVLERFLRENPESNYPFIFVGELMAEPPIECSLKLRQLILGDEEAVFQRVLLSKLSMPNFPDRCRQERIDIPDLSSAESGQVTFRQVFLLLAATKLRRLGVNQERLIALMRWMSDRDVERYAIMKISAGLNTFLYTDMGDNMDICSDIELLDWLTIGHQVDKPFILLSLNALFAEILDTYHLQDFEIDTSIRITIGRSMVYQTPNGRQISLSIPRNTRNITIYRPVGPMADDKEVITPSEYQSMMEFF